VPRFRLPRLAAPRGAGLLLAACCGLGVGLGCVDAHAQLATPQASDPFAPDYTTPAGKPPRFEKSNRKKRASTGGVPRTFQPIEPLAPPTSGAGTTGFNATNAPTKRTTTRASVYGGRSYGAASDDAAADDNASGAQANALTPPQDISPYQQPIPPLGSDARAEAPGQPPVSVISPIAKSKKRRARPDGPIDPYDPIGLRAGSFDIYPAVEILGGYNSNPNAVEGGDGAAVYTIAPEVKIKSNWSRHALNAELFGNYTGYSPDSTPTLSRPYVNGKVDGRLDANRDTQFDLGARVLVSTDNPGSPNLQAGLSELPLYFTFGGSAGVTRRFNRFELSLKSDAQRTAYDDSELTDGTTASNKDRNYNQFGGSLRGSYEFKPGIKPFIEVGADTRIHDEEPDVYGYQRNSKGLTGKVGSTFELTRLLTGEVAIGYTHRNYDDPNFGTLGGFVGDASLIWTVDALNTVKLTASSSIGESAVPGVSGVFYRDISVQYDHAFRRWLIGSLKLGVGADTYNGGSTSNSTTTTDICGCVITTPGETTPDRQDLRYTAGVGMTYKFTREVWFKGEFQQRWVRSNVAGYDYDESLFLAGIRLQR
jgi:hypothetical protein